jgi:copper resistance protein B
MDKKNGKTKMKMKMNSHTWMLLLASFGASPLWAQAQSGPMPSMDHSKMNHGSMPAAGNSASDAKKSMPVPVPVPVPMEGMSPQSMEAAPPAKDASMAGMDHGSMQGQGGPAPADARDPHVYSGGYTLESGPYALPGTRQLRMADEHNFGSILFNRFERNFGRNGSSSTMYDTQIWFGQDYDRLVIKAEGDVDRGKVQEARTEVLWGHAIAPFWDSQVGVRYDSGGNGPERKWLSVGVQGISPYWFEVDAAAYLGEGGRAALRLSAEYEILFTQKLILQPRVEVNFYSQDDTAREIGSDLSSATAGLRLRYEVNRQFAPYVGVEGSGKFGKTADLVRDGGANTSDTRWVAGVRFWY